MRNKVIISLFFFLMFFFTSTPLYADAFVTIVNPVRGRDTWVNKDINLFINHITPITNKNLSATWLIQYDALKDKQIVEVLRKLPKNQELGLFLEVSELLATDAFVPYVRGDGSWARPDKVFFSGYSIAHRKRLVDRSVRTFEAEFGYMPKSAGAWYIDAFTLSYLHDQYGITSSVLCSDQYSTDTYETWGKYFGFPYYPSRRNTQIPGSSEKGTLPVVVIQWAQRDPVRSYGPGVAESTYSMQVNDYTGHHQLPHSYFQKLFETYLNSGNSVNQVTIGLEVGTESAFLPEYNDQLEIVSKDSKLVGANVVTMNGFSEWMKRNIPKNSNYSLSTTDFFNPNIWVLWWMTPYYRVKIYKNGNTLSIQDLKIYDELYTTIDDFDRDSREVLYRSVPNRIDELLFHNAVRLTDSLISQKIEKNNDQLKLTYATKEGDRNILLTTQSVVINNKEFFSWQRDYKKENNTLSQELIRSFLISIKKFDAPVLIKYSYLDDRFYAGIPVDSTSILGIKTPNHAGTFSFPFQTSVRFKSFPPLPSLDIQYLTSPYKQTQEYITVSKPEEVVPRETYSIKEVEDMEQKGWVRVFENDAIQAWKRR